ncbi:hypothetical protein HAALTHF_16030n [Vreelandella aquamarina]|nr:hypothetical protein HAALTHF_16030n [Halomonas axialensis]
MQEVSADNAPVSKVKLPWHRTVVGKVAIFMLLGVVFAYLMGAMLGFTMVERSARGQWGAKLRSMHRLSVPPFAEFIPPSLCVPIPLVK